MAQVIGDITQRALSAALGLALAGLSASAWAQTTGFDQQAREAAWAGRVGEGLRLMDQHLAANPDDSAARLDRAKFLAWRGDYAGAVEALDALGEDSPEARALRARVYAWAGFRDTSLELNAPLYAADPKGYEPAFTQALASRLGEWPHEAMTSLGAVQAAKPDGRDTRDLARSVRLPLFSSIGVPLTLYRDSDDIEIHGRGVEGRLRLDDRWQVMADATLREHSAPANGPFAPVTGGDRVDERRLRVGARYALSPEASFEFMLGRSDLDPGDGEFIGHAEWARRTSDAFLYRIRAHRERMDASPRAVSLDVMREGVSVSGQWRPNLRDLVRGQGVFERLTDGNHRVAADLDYRHALFRSERVNLDVGAQGEWQSYSRDPGNGYYSPGAYMRVAPLVSSYIKLGDDIGVYLQGAIGVQRDETFDRWRRASDLGAELTVGIFSHWELAARAGYSERLNQFGQYEGINVGLALRYRFCEFRAERCPANAGP